MLDLSNISPECEPAKPCNGECQCAMVSINTPYGLVFGNVMSIRYVKELIDSDVEAGLSYTHD